ncbi:MAG: DNA repair exonuclease [Desulfobacterales bacterium]|nr:DNA repair exonuclease [Desulfobacterales bacterium]
MFKFIHTADIHLDSPLHRLEHYEGAPREEIRQASRRAFENLIDLALDESVDFVLIAGDLFDGDWRDYHTGLYFIAQIQRLNAAGIAVFIVSGNHDAAGRMTRSLPYPPNVHVFGHRQPETRTLDHLKVAVHGQSFAASAIMDNLARRYPEPVPGYFNIGLLHTSLNGREGHAAYAPCTLTDLEARGYDYWALGHVHQFEQVSRDPLVIFPGCLQGRNIRETGAKGSVLVVVEDRWAPEIIPRSHDVVRWAQLTVELDHNATTQTGLDAFRKGLEALIAQHAPLPVVARVVFTGDTAAHARISGDRDYWLEAVRSTAVAHFGERAWIESVRVETRPTGQGPTGPNDPGPFRELDRLVAEIEADDDKLLALGAVLSPLLRKMPVEYRQSDRALDMEDPECWRQIVREAHDLLRQGLKSEAPDT